MPAARSRLWAMAARTVQAALAAKIPGGHVRPGPVDEVGEYGFDDGVPAVGQVRIDQRVGVVGEERVCPQTVNSESRWFWSLTRRMISRAVIVLVVAANAV